VGLDCSADIGDPYRMQSTYRIVRCLCGYIPGVDFLEGTYLCRAAMNGQEGAGYCRCLLSLHSVKPEGGAIGFNGAIQTEDGGLYLTYNIQLWSDVRLAFKIVGRRPGRPPLRPHSRSCRDVGGPAIHSSGGRAGLRPDRQGLETNRAFHTFYPARGRIPPLRRRVERSFWSASSLNLGHPAKPRGGFFYGIIPRPAPGGAQALLPQALRRRGR